MDRRNGQNVDAKMALVIKPQKEVRSDKLLKHRAEIEQFIKEELIDQMISKAHAIGESLFVCRDI